MGWQFFIFAYDRTYIRLQIIRVTIFFTGLKLIWEMLKIGRYVYWLMASKMLVRPTVNYSVVILKCHAQYNKLDRNNS